MSIEPNNFAIKGFVLIFAQPMCPLLSKLSARPGFSLVDLGPMSSKENEIKISILFR